MHDLAPLTALGSSAPSREAIGATEIVEVFDLALASVAARLGQEDACRARLTEFLGTAPPAAGEASNGSGISAFWMGPDQWMLSAHFSETEILAATVKNALRKAASVTEQSDAWGCFDVLGDRVVDLFERLCPVPTRRMTAGEAQRSTIHHLGCFVICLEAGRGFRVLGARSSAGSLHHALVTAARAVA